MGNICIFETQTKVKNDSRPEYLGRYITDGPIVLNYFAMDSGILLELFLCSKPHATKSFWPNANYYSYKS